MSLGRWWRLLPGLWAGALLCVALMAAPSAFAVLPRADAGRFVVRLFALEAWLSLGLAAVLLGMSHFGVITRSVRSRAMHRALLWATVLCTLLGYFAMQHFMPAARAGQGPFSFGQLHLLSTLLYALKTIAAVTLAWRAAASATFSPAPSS